MTQPTWVQPPDDLSKTALEYWNFYAKGLRRDGRLTPDAVENLKSLCRLLALARIAEAEIERDGATIGAASGGRKQHPAVQTLFRATKAAAPLLATFGLE